MKGASRTYQELIEKVMPSDPAPETNLRSAWNLSSIYTASAGLYRRTGESAKAEEMESRRLQLWREWDHKLPNNQFVLRQIAAAASN